MIEIINLPKILDDRGNLSVIEEMINIPFKYTGFIGSMMFRVENSGSHTFGKMKNSL